MQFCKECGGALNLFESNDQKICWNCSQKLEKKQTPNTLQGGVDDLAEAQFRCENGNLVLRAPEGWVLWSGPMDKPVNLATILKRAQRIQAIRKKNSGNSR